MHVHEYQAKEILKKFGLPIPEFGVASNLDEVKQIIKNLNLQSAVIKIQVHAGGRGKSGGVKFAKGAEEILKVCDQLIGMKMVNNQTGAQGVVAKRVLITEAVEVAKEYYLGAAINRQKAQPILIASQEGGVDIEEVAAKTPEKILQLPIELDGQIRSYHLIRLTHFMGWKGKTAQEGMQAAYGLARSFIETDASLLEINPLIETPQGSIWAIDTKLTIDDNALFRQEEIASYFDPSQLPIQEVMARKFDLAYIALSGEIGCMVNGAGLAMATMDMIQHYGGSPANFLDVGGSADADKVAEGFKLILADPQVKVIFVNIFGGIMNCVTIAEGIIQAARACDIKLPVLICLEGTETEKARQKLADSKLKLHTVTSMSEGAKKAAEYLKE